MSSFRVLSFLLLLSITWLPLQAADIPTRKPNVLLIYSDDHGWADLGIQGVDQEVRTPHLNQLARDGVRFTRGYVSAPQCMPSRCGVITGRYQQRFGVEDNSRGPLPLSQLTIAERLKPAGYLSGFVGKSHLDIGGEKGQAKGSRILLDHLPHHQGFDEYFRGEVNEYYASHGLDGKPFVDAPRLVRDKRFRVEVQTEAALSFLDRRAAHPEQPWFLYLAWYAPHVPLESPEPWFSKTPESLPIKRRQALAMIAAMDDGLGRLRASIKEMGQEENTLIVFIGDNGAPLGEAWNGSVNQPLVGQKGMLSEGGIRVPFVAAWPGHWPAQRVFDHPVSNLDVAATAVSLAGLSPEPKLDGVDLTPFVTDANRAAPHDRLFWRWGSQSAVLEMPYKLIKLGNRPALLFDVTRPDGEHLDRNLAARHPEIVKRLEQRLRAWAAELQPPGLSSDDSAFSRRHESLFTEHKIIAGDVSARALPSTTSPTGSSDERWQGWIARNGTLMLKDGALALTTDPDSPKNSRPFVTHSMLNLSGPVTVTLRIRSRTAGQGQASITWRTKQASFAAHQTSAFDWPVGSEWKEVQVHLAETDRIIHVRVTPPRGSTGIEIQTIQFKDRKDAVHAFRFDGQ